MDYRELDADARLAAVPFAELRRQKFDVTHRVLGETMAVSDEEWQAPSRLPGWTRAHVATHLARGAENLAWAVQEMVSADRSRHRGITEAQRTLTLDRGSERPGVELQIDLDTTAGLLNATISDVPEELHDRPVALLPGLHIPFRAVPLARLHELATHLSDLDLGFELASIHPDTAYWLLEWVLVMIDGRPDFPRLRLHRDSDVAEIGAEGETVDVWGTDAAFYAWLTGRGDGSRVEGSEQVQLPIYG